MKEARLIVVVFLATIIFFALCGPAWAGYTTTQLSYGVSGDGQTYFGNRDPQINDSGQVVWADLDSSDIYLYSGGVTTLLTDYGYAGGGPRINDSGQVVWGGNNGSFFDHEIFLYSGGTTTQLTYDNIGTLFGEYNPQINNSGQVVWQGTGGSGVVFDQEVFLYSGGVTTQLTDNSSDEENPQINDSGQVVWEGNGGIFLYSGGLTTQLPNSVGGRTPQINDSGQVVWQEGGPLGGEIYLYSGGVTTHLSNSNSENESPQINSAGQVVWRGFDDGSYSKIFLYSNGVTTILDNPRYSSNFYEPQTFSAYVPVMNNAGQVVWEGWNGYGWEIFLASQCSGNRPTLALSRGNAFWASYADFTAGELSVNMTIRNSGTDTANSIMITGSSDTNGVTRSTAVPALIGDIAGGAGSSITLKYHIPAGVGSFRTSVYATALDLCGTTFSYPSP